MLNLGANIRGQLWQMRHPMSPQNDFDDQIMTNYNYFGGTKKSEASNFIGFRHNEDFPTVRIVTFLSSKISNTTILFLISYV